MTTSDRREFLFTAGAGMAATWLAPSLEFLHPALPQAKVPLALIGAGRQGRAILGELATIGGCEVVAVCDNDETRLTAALRRVEKAKGYASAAEMLAKETAIAGVLIATPTHLHKEFVLAVIAAKKHVYCESPLASTLEDCTAIAAAARDSKQVCAAGFQARSNPVYALARSFFKAGTLRDLAFLRAQNNKKTSWRTAGSTPERDRELNWHLDPKISLGLLGELGSQQFDVFHWFLGRHPVSVRARGDLRLHKDGREIPDTVNAEFLFDDGLRLDYSCTLANSFEGRFEVIAGAMAAIKLAWTHGWMFKEADAPTQGWEVYANRQQFHDQQGITLIADATKLASQGKLQEGVGLPYSSLYYALADFINAIANAKPAATSFADGARSSAVGILAHRALVEKKDVAIDPQLLAGL
ncbi:MAG TPA: Gfo/Idh/MocA family oxidoreductase [Planctomycetota bacterium]|nr:Gfo/Idh/MocA family oxidoreductase [Planctomycetota bacterium]